MLAAMLPAVVLAAQLYVPVAPTGVVGRAQSRTIYLNHKGATVRPGANDAAAQTSTIVTEPATIAAWNASDATWSATVACMRDMWARFDVTITEDDPGTRPHVEALFGGTPSDIGRPANVGGIAPFASDCGVVENAIVFTFAAALPQDPELICEVMSQEIGHAYGLDHELLAADPMSYLPYDGKRAFQEQGAACGEKTARPCGLGATSCRASQSSLEILLARLGAAGGDGIAPVLAITSPVAHESVEPGFTVTARATDDIGITSVALYVDGAKTETLTAAPYELATDPDLATGAHTLMVEARDANDNVTVREVDVTVETSPFGCSAGGGGAGLGACVALLALGRRRRGVQS